MKYYVPTASKMRTEGGFILKLTPQDEFRPKAHHTQF